MAGIVSYYFNQAKTACGSLYRDCSTNASDAYEIISSLFGIATRMPMEIGNTSISTNKEIQICELDRILGNTFTPEKITNCTYYRNILAITLVASCVFPFGFFLSCLPETFAVASFAVLSLGAFGTLMYFEPKYKKAKKELINELSSFLLPEDFDHFLAKANGYRVLPFLYNPYPLRSYESKICSRCTFKRKRTHHAKYRTYCDSYAD